MLCIGVMVLALGGVSSSHTNDAQKRNARLVFTECMKDIKHQIANDYNRLNAALSANNDMNLAPNGLAPETL